MQDSIFTKIIRGEIPSYKIYEDEKTLAFLDIHPKTLGHTLVVPKKQVEFAWDLSEEDYTALMAAAKKVALRIKEVLQARYVGEQIIGMDVPHAHVHIFPFNNLDEYLFVPDMSADPDNESLAAVAEKLAF
jgi:histidine triad (HIT) family protein